MQTDAQAPQAVQAVQADFRTLDLTLQAQALCAAEGLGDISDRLVGAFAGARAWVAAWRDLGRAGSAVLRYLEGRPRAQAALRRAMGRVARLALDERAAWAPKPRLGRRAASPVPHVVLAEEILYAEPRDLVAPLGRPRAAAAAVPVPPVIREAVLRRRARAARERRAAVRGRRAVAALADDFARRVEI